ncbi:hypothetical protein H6G27_14615 [Nostoc linckia FACHB-104]|nr:hypothetical protein [Nostoc linckia FACHB-104]
MVAILRLGFGDWGKKGDRENNDSSYQCNERSLFARGNRSHHLTNKSVTE